ncbi:asparagine synthase (glutamine-hydrolyzing) [candidate division KSB1 bacterium]|nr:asparagine synthase (glutamine-hydrolyzing) [candidate division KSB1 bacterium]
MCGITGKLNFSDTTPISRGLIEQMIGIMRHRGPDECGIYLDDAIGMGHARLSIIDLSGGAQPIHNEDLTLWIVYNGEVFNYIELKKNLEKKGHHFYTTTDTEVILHLFEEKGADCLQELNGQFAFAIWNSVKKELFLARDRVGIRPLYYTQQNKSFLFASEIKSIFIDPAVSRNLDLHAVQQVCNFWTTLPGETVFQGISELPPGHYMFVSEKGIRLQRFWEIPFYAPDEQLDWPVERIRESILELLVDAIRLRLRADVPVGCYLSGGLDSSGITTLVVKNFNSHVRTFGIQFEEKAFDERDHQQAMVSFLGTAHTEMLATNDLIGSSLTDVLWHCEKPLLRTAPVPLYLLSQVVRDNGFKVVLTGEGADEVFGGYNIFREAKVRQFWAKQPNSRFRGLLLRKLYPYIFSDPRLAAMQQSFFAQGLKEAGSPFFSHQIRWQNTNKVNGYFVDGLPTHYSYNDEIEKLRQWLPPAFEKWDYLAKAQYLEMQIFLSNYLLSSQGDRVAMAHSIEIRVPYLDYRLIDFMGRVPARLKINGLTEKYILKKTFENIVPEKIWKRDKHPYRAPIIQSLFSESNHSLVERWLNPALVKENGFFNPGKVELLLRKIQTSKNPGEIDNMALIGLLSTHIIYDQFVKNFPGKKIQFVSPDIFIDLRTNRND